MPKAQKSKADEKDEMVEVYLKTGSILKATTLDGRRDSLGRLRDACAERGVAPPPMPARGAIAEAFDGTHVQIVAMLYHGKQVSIGEIAEAVDVTPQEVRRIARLLTSLDVPVSAKYRRRRRRP
jgi:hypothetical protein